MFETDFQTAQYPILIFFLPIVKLLIRLLYRLTIKFQTRMIVNNVGLHKRERERHEEKTKKDRHLSLCYILVSSTSFEDQKKYIYNRQTNGWIHCFFIPCQWSVRRKREGEGEEKKQMSSRTHFLTDDAVHVVLSFSYTRASKKVIEKVLAVKERQRCADRVNQHT